MNVPQDSDAHRHNQELHLSTVSCFTVEEHPRKSKILQHLHNQRLTPHSHSVTLKGVRLQVLCGGGCDGGVGGQKSVMLV